MSDEVRRYIVAGAPCSGKSTFVRFNARAGDLIYDYDTLHAALSGFGAHQHDPNIRPYVLAARDAIYSELEAHQQQPAWVITSTRRTDDLKMLQERLGADVILLNVDRAEAHLRCDADERPEVWHEYIDNWFDESDIDAAAWPQPVGIKAMEEHMKTKTYRAPVEFKVDSDGVDTGAFRAVFATLDVVDHDGDITVKGAFPEGQEVIVEPWNHDYQLPVGKATIHEDDERAWVDGTFLLNTSGGRDHYETVKALGPLTEWSYTFRIIDGTSEERNGERVRVLRKLDVAGVSPVTRGAGLGTGTIAIKGAGNSDHDDANDGEGQTGDGEPSGIAARDVQAQIDILRSELEVMSNG